MRCQQAKRLLTEGDLSDPRLRDHLRQCESCAREAAASKLLDLALETGKTEQSAVPTPWPFMKARLEALEADHKSETTTMFHVKNLFGLHRKVSLSLLIGLCAAAAFLLVPFSYTTVVGYQAVIDTETPQSPPDPGRVSEAMMALGYDSVSVNYNHSGDRLRVTLTKLPTHYAAREAIAAFMQIAGVDNGKFKTKSAIQPVEAKVSGSLYAQIKEKMIHVEIDSRGLSDPQLAEEIASKLAGVGVAANVGVVTDTEGKRTITLEGLELQDSLAEGATIMIIQDEDDSSPSSQEN